MPQDGSIPLRRWVDGGSNLYFTAPWNGLFWHPKPRSYVENLTEAKTGTAPSSRHHQVWCKLNESRISTLNPDLTADQSGVEMEPQCRRIVGSVRRCVPALEQFYWTASKLTDSELHRRGTIGVHQPRLISSKFTCRGVVRSLRLWDSMIGSPLGALRQFVYKCWKSCETEDS